MSASDYVPISFKNRLHLVGRPQMSTRSNTTLADLLTPLLGANPFSTVRTSFRWQLSDERDDGVADGRQAWLRRRCCRKAKASIVMSAWRWRPCQDRPSK